MKKLFIIAVVCLPLLFMGCEKRIIDTRITISGTVTDRETNEYLENVKVTLSPSTQNDILTDYNGTFQFPNVEYDDHYVIIVQKKGYKDGHKNIYPQSGGEWKVAISMDKLP